MTRPRLGTDEPLKTTPSSRHPFQILIMFALALSGLSVVFKDATPGSVNDLVAPWAVFLWGASMAAGGIMAIASAYWPDRITGLLLERISLGAIAGVCFVYAAIVIVTFRGTNGTLTSSLVLAVAGACIWRLRQVQRELNRLMYFIELGRGGGDGRA